ncbi:MAG: ABC transporter permease [Actinomycetota bacterium]|nr:ABC transporter permease [Actinomycetota bacterium]
MKTLILYKTMFKQTIIGLKRYLFETISGTATLFLFFLALFYGAKALAGSSLKLANTQDGLIVGYMVWSLAIFAYFSMAQDLIQEAQLGTLEQLAMSPMGLSKVLLGRALSGLVWQFITIAVMLTLMMVSTGRYLHVDVISMVPLMVLTLAGVIGLSLVMGGLAIVFKRVQAILQIMQIAFVAFIAVPLSRAPFLKYMPLKWGNELLTRVMRDGKSIFQLPWQDVAFLIGHAVVYMTIGLVVFKYFENVARRRGLLGHY